MVRGGFHLDNYLGVPLKPADRQIFNMGIQERQNNYMMTAPIIYSMVQQSVIVRTCITQLKQEVYRRGYVWEKAYDSYAKVVVKNTTDL